MGREARAPRRQASVTTPPVTEPIKAPIDPAERLHLDQNYLRFLASQVEDEAHFERILASIEQPLLRDKVHKLVTPMLTCLDAG